MVKFIKPGKVVVVLNGRYAGHKAVVVKNFDDGQKGVRFFQNTIRQISSEGGNSRKFVEARIRPRCHCWRRALPPQGHPRHGQEAHCQALQGQAFREDHQLQPLHAHSVCCLRHWGRRAAGDMRIGRSAAAAAWGGGGGGGAGSRRKKKKVAKPCPCP